MTKIIVITSGKGGVGKTTTSASFASGLARRGHKTVVIDFDIGLRNLDLLLGCERRVVFDLINVIQGESNLHQALIRDKHCANLHILAASQTRDKTLLTIEGVQEVMNQLIEMNFDYVVCDSPAGIENGAKMAMYFADEALIVTNPEISSVRDSDKIVSMLTESTCRAIEARDPVKQHLLITRYSADRVSKGEMLSLDDILSVLPLNLIGVVPESSDVLIASNQGTPVIYQESSGVSHAYNDIVDRFLGINVPMRHLKNQQESYLKRFFSGW